MISMGIKAKTKRKKQSVFHRENFQDHIQKNHGKRVKN